MLQLEVLVSKLLAVDRLAARAVAARKVTLLFDEREKKERKNEIWDGGSKGVMRETEFTYTLEHELGNDAVENKDG
jgi:hypothetical protein